MNVMY